MSIIDPRTITAIGDDRLLAADRARLIAAITTSTDPSRRPTLRSIAGSVASPLARLGGRRRHRPGFPYTIRDVPSPQ